MQVDKTRVRDAATVIILRDQDTSPRVLMGQRGAKAAFMPNKFVFPGGAVDATDFEIALKAPLPKACIQRLSEDAQSGLHHALPAAAIRELWEETGLILGQKTPWHSLCPDSWASYAETGHVPDATHLEFIFRAITPPGRPRRFDARFFLLNADHLSSDPDDFSAASDELSHLQWIPLEQVRSYDMPFITEVVLSEVQARLATGLAPYSIPFFKNDDEESLFLRLYGNQFKDRYENR